MERFKIEQIFEGLLHGIVDKKECELKVKVAQVSYKIVDDNENESNELKSWFAFHSLSKGPFLFGMDGIFQQIGIKKEPDTDVVIINI